MKYIQKEYLHIYNKAVYILLISVHPLFAQERQVLSCCGRNQSLLPRGTLSAPFYLESHQIIERVLC